MHSIDHNFSPIGSYVKTFLLIKVMPFFYGSFNVCILHGYIMKKIKIGLVIIYVPKGPKKVTGWIGFKVK